MRPSGSDAPADWPLDRVGRRTLRGLLWLAPPGFRRRFGRSLLVAVVQRADDVRRAGGTLAVVRYWMHQFLDLGRTILREWLELLRRARPRRVLPPSSPEAFGMENLWMDLRFALRTLVARPGVSAIIIVTLALAIGASTAIFSILNAVVLEPLPYEEPGELVVFLDDLRAMELAPAPLAAYEVRALRESARLFEEIQASTLPFQLPLNDETGRPEQITSASLSPGFLRMLGERPMIGRTFTGDEARPVPPGVVQGPGASAPLGVVLLSHDFWQRRFGGDPDVIGTTVDIGSRDHEVIGVMPPGFRMFWPPYLSNQAVAGGMDVYTPLEVDIANATTGPGFLQVVGRLAEGVTLEQARAEVDAITARQRQEHERSGRHQIYTSLEPWSAAVTSRVRPALLALLGAVGFVLLIACANIANLLLARAVDRRQEMAIRSAIGAGRGRLARQSLTESMVLASIGAILGLLAASWGLDTLLTLVPSTLPRAEAVTIDPTVTLFALGATVLAVLLFGVGPAVALSSTSSASLNDRGTGGGSHGRSRLRAGLVVAEVALSLVLLLGAGLMLRSFATLQGTDLGFETDRVTTFRLSLPPFEYQSEESRATFLRGALDRLERLSGVESAGAGALPLSGNIFTGTFRPDDMPEGEVRPEANFRGAGAGYFETIGMPVVAGRTFEPSEPDPNVVVIDERMASTIFAGRDPLGEVLHAWLGGVNGEPNVVPVQVIGVVGDIRDEAITGEGRRTIYFPYELLGFPQYDFAVRSRLPMADLVPLVREQIAALDPGLPIYDVRPLEGYVDDALAPTRFTLVLIGLFGGLAVLLAAVGLYGVLAQSVREQTRDIGVRMAFGATAGEVLRRVVGRGATLAGIGALLGLAVAVPLTRMLRSLFVGIEPTDPLTIAGTTLLLLAVAVVACAVPARRAARMDPASSLRAE